MGRDEFNFGAEEEWPLHGASRSPKNGAHGGHFRVDIVDNQEDELPTHSQGSCSSVMSMRSFATTGSSATVGRGSRRKRSGRRSTSPIPSGRVALAARTAAASNGTGTGTSTSSHSPKSTSASSPLSRTRTASTSSKRIRTHFSPSVDSSTPKSQAYSLSQSSTSASALTDETSHVSSTLRSVRGAGASQMAIQDAGNYQMLHDDCTYMCSTILSAKKPSTALEAALDLLALLQNRKTRQTLWQGDARMRRQRDAKLALNAVIEGETDSNDHDSERDPSDAFSQDSNDENHRRSISTKKSDGARAFDLAQFDPKSLDAAHLTVLEAIGHVIAAIPELNRPKSYESSRNDLGVPTSARKKKRLAFSSRNTGSSSTSSPIMSSASAAKQVVKSAGRTKSARRKRNGVSRTTSTETPTSLSSRLHESSTRDQSGYNGLGSNRSISPGASAFTSANSPWLTPPLRQVLALIVYYLSYDCTLSQSQSVAGLGGPSRAGPRMAKRIRSLLLKQGKTLLGLAHLIVADTHNSQQLREDATNIGSPPSAKSRHRRSRSADSISFEDASFLDSQPQSQFSIASSTLPTKHVEFEAAWEGSAGTIGSTEPPSGGDPTSSGRRKRRSRRLLFNESQTSSIAGVGDQDRMGTFDDAGSGAAMESPTKSRTPLSIDTPKKRNQASNYSGANGSGSNKKSRSTLVSKLNFTSDEESSPSLITPLEANPLLHDYDLPLADQSPSPDRLSVHSTGSMASSYYAGISLQLTDKLQEMILKVKLELPRQQKSPKVASSLLESLDTVQWSSLVALESLERIITGKDSEAAESSWQDTDEGGDEGIHDITTISSSETKDESDIEDVDPDSIENPLMETNRLLSRSTCLPTLARAMSIYLREIAKTCDLTSSQSSVPQRDHGTDLLNAPAGKSTELQEKKSRSHVVVQHYRITVLATLIDGACLWHSDNRISLCQGDDVFSFDPITAPLSTTDTFSFLDSPEIGKKETKPIPLPSSLVPSLLHAIDCLGRHVTSSQSSDERAESEDNVLTDVLLVALRTLTSLTHQNELATKQVVQLYSNPVGHSDEGTSLFRGIDVLANTFYRLQSDDAKIAVNENGAKSQVSDAHEQQQHHRQYDCSIFCLNSMANIVETGNLRGLMAELVLPSQITDDENASQTSLRLSPKSSRNKRSPKKSKNAESWLSWTCRWVVEQTESFRDAVVVLEEHGDGLDRNNETKPNDSTGEKRNTKRVLEDHEDDKLIAAGNGCVLMAYLLLDSDYSTSAEVDPTTMLRKMILHELPGKAMKTKITFLQNTLQAFCNYYHYSMGELSIVVIAPVRKLLKGLHELQQEEEEQ